MYVALTAHFQNMCGYADFICIVKSHEYFRGKMLLTTTIRDSKKVSNSLPHLLSLCFVCGVTLALLTWTQPDSTLFPEFHLNTMCQQSNNIASKQKVIFVFCLYSNIKCKQSFLCYYYILKNQYIKVMKAW